jgi:hypothetical protein
MHIKFSLAELPDWLLRSGTSTEGSGGEGNQGDAGGTADPAAGGTADGSAGDGSGSSQTDSSAGAPAPGGEGGEGEGEGGAKPDPAKPAAEAKPAKPDHRDRRIAKLTAQLRELQGQAKTTPGGAEAQPAMVPASEVESLATQKAQTLAAQAEFNRQCNEAAATGKATFGEAEFSARVQELTKLVDVQDTGSVQQYNAFLSAAIRTGEGPRLIHQLGGDLDEADRIMALDPVNMGIELTKLALAKGTGPEATKAPDPLKPIGARGTSHEAISPGDPERADRLSTAEWMRRREAEVNARAAA